MSGGARAGCVWACAIALGCASTTITGSSLDARFAGADARRARELAPDLYAEAEHARDQARGVSDDSARRDAADSADLFLAAAIAEAARIQFDDERTGVDAAIERAVAERVAHEQARHAVEAEIASTEAASLAHATAAHAIDAAALHATTRRPQDGQTLDAAAAFLRERAALVLAAATALGAPAEASAEAERAIDRAKIAKSSPTKKLQRAQDALAAAERALDAARAGAGAKPGARVTEITAEGTSASVTH